MSTIGLNLRPAVSMHLNRSDRQPASWRMKMTAVESMPKQIGIDPSNMQMFLDVYAIEVKAGATLPEAIERVHLLFTRMANEADKPQSQQADWFIAWKQAMAVEVWHTVRKQNELKRIMA